MRFACSLLIIIAMTSAVSAQANPPPAGITASWNGGSGNWEDPSRWTGLSSGYPTGDDYRVSIASGDSHIATDVAVTTVFATGGASLHIDPGGSLMLNRVPHALSVGGDLTINGGDVTVDGTLTSNGVVTLSSGTLSGSGTIQSGFYGTHLEWSGGRISGSGSVNLKGSASSSSIAIPASSQVYFGERAITLSFGSSFDWNGGTFLSTGGGSIDFNFFSRLKLNASGTFAQPESVDAAPIQISLTSGSIIKNSPGTTRIANAQISTQGQSYVEVRQGKLLLDRAPVGTMQTLDVDGELEAPSLKAVRISGSGTVRGLAVSAQQLFPGGESVGQLTIDGNFETYSAGSLAASAWLDFDVLGPAANQHDHVDVSGEFSFGTTAIVPLGTPTTTLTMHFGNYIPQAGDTFELVHFSSLKTFLAPTLHYTGVGEGFLYSITTTDHAMVFTAVNDAHPVPEPTTIGLCLVAWPLLRRRR
ncbi:MAG TPA: hypothetical protein VF669_00470 [Tepidisphaeraceae bacterium]|jgi:hypothetical protein